MDAAEVARRTRSARAYRGLTQDELAEAIGVHTQTIKRFENEGDGNTPDVGRRAAIATACELPGWFDETETGRPVPPTDLEPRLARIEALVEQIPDGMEMLRALVTPGILDKALAVLREVQEQDRRETAARPRSSES